MNSRNELSSLQHATGKALDGLFMRAAAIRDKAWGKTFTYSRKVFVPLTNMCRDECGYCTFVKRPGDPAANVMTPEQVMAVVAEGEAAGCKEVLFSLGEKPELRYPLAQTELARHGHTSMVDYLAEMCALVLRESSLIPHVNAGTLSEADILKLRPVSASMGMMLETVSTRLLKKGMAHYACPDKAPKPRLNTLELAGKHHVPFTTGILIGIGETWDERIDALTAINEIHQRHGHIQEVIVQNFRAKPDIAMAYHPEPSHDDMCRTLALARVILDPSISLQAPPNLHEHYADYIDAGMNDWGGISPVTRDFINPECAWPQLDLLKSATEAKGFMLQERLTAYPKFIHDSQRFLDANMRGKVQRSARPDGLAAVQMM